MVADLDFEKRSGSVGLPLKQAAHRAALPYREALVADGIPLASFRVQDLNGEFERLCDLGVVFSAPPIAAS